MKKRSPYRPRAVNPNPLARILPAPLDQRRRVLGMFDSALLAIISGKHPGFDDWSALSDAINVVETLALHLGKLPQAGTMPYVQRAIEAMVRAADRYKAGKGMRMDGQGIEALRNVIDIYAQCMELLPEQVMTDAQEETRRRLAKLLADKPDGVHIVSEAA